MKNDDRKTALKLINQYAESYSRLEQENKALKSEILDLKTNLMINKEIIQGFFQYNNSDERTTFYLSKLKEEGLIQSKLIEKMIKENEGLKKKLLNTEHLTNVTLEKVREDNDKLCNKIFVLENIVVKKDILIESYIRKLSKVNNKSTLNTSTQENVSTQNDKEVYVVDPSKIANALHDEVEMYKTIYEKLSLQVKEMQTTISKLDKTNSDYETQISKLKQDLKLNNLTIKNDAFHAKKNSNNNIHINLQNTKNTIINVNKSQIKSDDLNEEVLKSDNTVIMNRNLRTASPNSKPVYTHVKGLKSKSTSTNEGINLQLVKHYETFEEKTRNIKDKFEVSEEWNDVLKQCGISQAEFVKFSKTKVTVKLVDAIEYLYKLLTDKNFQIKLLTDENDNLNSKNIELNKENIILIDKNRELVNRKNEEIGKNRKLMKSILKSQRRLNGVGSKRNSNIPKDSGRYNPETLRTITSSEFKCDLNNNENSFISEICAENDVNNLVNIGNIKILN